MNVDRAAPEAMGQHTDDWRHAETPVRKFKDETFSIEKNDY